MTEIQDGEKPLKNHYCSTIHSTDMKFGKMRNLIADLVGEFLKASNITTSKHMHISYETVCISCKIHFISGLGQYCGNSSALAMGLPQSWSKPLH